MLGQSVSKPGRQTVSVVRPRISTQQLLIRMDAGHSTAFFSLFASTGRFFPFHAAMAQNFTTIGGSLHDRHPMPQDGLNATVIHIR